MRVWLATAWGKLGKQGPFIGSAALPAAPGGSSSAPWTPFGLTAPARKNTRHAPEQNHLGRHPDQDDRGACIRPNQWCTSQDRFRLRGLAQPPLLRLEISESPGFYHNPWVSTPAAGPRRNVPHSFIAVRKGFAGAPNPLQKCAAE